MSVSVRLLTKKLKKMTTTQKVQQITTNATFLTTIKSNKKYFKATTRRSKTRRKKKVTQSRKFVVQTKLTKLKKSKLLKLPYHGCRYVQKLRFYQKRVRNWGQVPKVQQKASQHQPNYRWNKPKMWYAVSQKLQPNEWRAQAGLETKNCLQSSRTP